VTHINHICVFVLIILRMVTWAAETCW